MADINPVRPTKWRGSHKTSVNPIMTDEVSAVSFSINYHVILFLKVFSFEDNFFIEFFFVCLLVFDHLHSVFSSTSVPRGMYIVPNRADTKPTSNVFFWCTILNMDKQVGTLPLFAVHSSSRLGWLVGLNFNPQTQTY